MRNSGMLVERPGWFGCVVIDGTSLRGTDIERAKGFGAVGSTRNGGNDGGQGPRAEKDSPR